MARVDLVVRAVSVAEEWDNDITDPSMVEDGYGWQADGGQTGKEQPQALGIGHPEIIIREYSDAVHDRSGE